VGYFALFFINDGTKINVFPKRYYDLRIDMRTIPGEITKTSMNELQKILDPNIEEDKDLHAEMKMRPVNWDPYLIPKDEPTAPETIKSLKMMAEKVLEIHGKSACTDGPHLSRLVWTPPVIFGPGNEYHSHNPYEFVEIKF
jgi:acetylornithine deacetylase/succinyl-diaminopimelate desuccinylase-like protein